MASTDEKDAVDPISLFRDEIVEFAHDHEDLVKLIDSKLENVAISLGVDRCREGLVPLLAELVNLDNDEVNAIMARHLGKFPQYIGGIAQSQQVLRILERIVSSEEVVVREAAVASISQIASLAGAKDVPVLFIPMLKKMVVVDDPFMPRSTAASIMDAVYARADASTQRELRAMFLPLCNDESPVIRRAALQASARMARVMDKEHILSELLLPIKLAAQDDLENIRSFVVDPLHAIALKFNAAEQKTHILPIVDNLVDDASWRVRSLISTALPKFVEVFPESNRTAFLPFVARLLVDENAETRQAMALSLARTCTLIKAPVTEALGASLMQASKDSIIKVRFSLSSAIVLISPNMSGEAGQKLLFNLVANLSTDENYQVRCNLLNNLDVVSKAHGTEIITHLLPTINNLAKDSNWRVRLSIFNQLDACARILGAEQADKQLLPTLTAGLVDPAAFVRDRACQQVGAFVGLFGEKWFLERILPALTTVFDHESSYTRRATVLQCVAHITPHVALGTFESQLLVFLHKAVQDPVANVRVVAAQSLGDAIACASVAANASLLGKMNKWLEQLTSDEDPDVKHYSRTSLASPGSCGVAARNKPPLGEGNP